MKNLLKAINDNNPVVARKLIGDATYVPKVVYGVRDIIAVLQSLIENTVLPKEAIRAIVRQLSNYAKYIGISNVSIFAFNEFLNAATQHLEAQKNYEDILQRCDVLELIYDEFEVKETSLLLSDDSSPLQKYLLKTLREENYPVAKKLLEIILCRKPTWGSEAFIDDILLILIDDLSSEAQHLLHMVLDHLDRTDEYEQKLIERVFTHTNLEGKTPLVAACAKSRWDIVERMIEIRGRILDEKTDAIGYGLVLLEAYKQKRHNTVTLLLENNAPLDEVINVVEQDEIGKQILQVEKKRDCSPFLKS